MIDQGIKQIKQILNPNCQSNTFSSIEYFKTGNRIITALFQGEVKYLNQKPITVSQKFLIRLGSLSMRLSNLAVS